MYPQNDAKMKQNEALHENEAMWQVWYKNQLLTIKRNMKSVTPKFSPIIGHTYIHPQSDPITATT